MRGSVVGAAPGPAPNGAPAVMGSSGNSVGANNEIGLGRAAFTDSGAGTRGGVCAAVRAAAAVAVSITPD